MDPTLAPGYVPPNSSKPHKAKHHWADVRKSQSRSSSNNSDADTKDEKPRPTSPLAHQSLSLGTSQPFKSQAIDKARHVRMASWRGARSPLSDGEAVGGPADLEEVPLGVKRQALRLEDYTFPTHRLRPVMDGRHYTPIP